VILEPSQTQVTQYVQGQAFPSAALQQNLDRLTQMVIRLQDQINRTVIAPDGDVSPTMVLPSAAARTNKALMFDGNGNAALGVPVTQTIGAQQVQYFGTDSGAANAYAVTVASPSIPFTAAPGALVSFKVGNNNTGASTLAVNGGTAISVTYQNLAPLLPGQFAAGSMVQVMFDGIRWQYLGPIFGSGSYLATMTGVSGTVTGSIPWTVSGEQLTLNIPNGVFFGTSTAHTLTLTGMPAAITPVSTYYSPIVVASDNSSPIYTAFLAIGGGVGTITAWYSAGGPGGWTNSGTKAIGPATVTCSLN
jgi:hypothetical protein